MDNYPPEEKKLCIAGITYNIEQGSDNVFYWISRLCDFERKDWVVNKNGKNKYDYKYRNLKIVWKILHRFIEENSKYAFVNKPIRALQEFYKENDPHGKADLPLPCRASNGSKKGDRLEL